MSDKRNDQDSLILQLLSLNDDRAMSIMFDLYFEELFQKVTYYVRDEDAAKDIVQDLFVVLWTKRHEHKLHIPIKAYLHRAALNRSLNHLRDTLKFVHEDEDFPIDKYVTSTSDFSADKALNIKELEARIDFAINRLPEKLRIPFLLSRNESMTHQEISKVLDITAVVVEKRIMAALKHMREYLKHYLHGILVLLHLI